METRNDTNFLKKVSKIEKSYLQNYEPNVNEKDTIATYLSKIGLFDSFRLFLSSWSHDPLCLDYNFDVYLNHDEFYKYGDTINVVAQLKPLFHHNLYSIADWNYKEYAEVHGNEIYYYFPTKDFVKEPNLPAKLKIEIKGTLKNNVTNEKSEWKWIPELKIQ